MAGWIAHRRGLRALSAARETLINAIKHAQAHRIWIDLERHDGLASLRVSDDGVGISEATMAQKAQEGHIGLSSIRAKALASGPTWFNLVFNAAADFGEGLVQVVG
jgi:nitrate/nitrite-specific signal transduction histidine kinase